MALHEIPEDKYEALELNNFRVIVGKTITVTYEKLNIDAISTESNPCTGDHAYSSEFCFLQKVVLKINMSKSLKVFLFRRVKISLKNMDANFHLCWDTI